MPLMFGIILSTVAFATITLVTPGNGKVDAETLPSTKFITGSRVYVTMNSSNVRQVPAGSLLGTQINGKQGTVNQGPIDALFDNVAVHWWLIDFDSGVDGWVGEDTLEKVSSSVQQTYTVVAGDTLSAIGKKLGIAWQDIAALNNMGYPYFLSIGQVLKISASSNTPTPTPAPEDGFNGGFVSLNFDDGWESAFTKAVPVLNSAGYKGTFYVVTEALGWDGFMTSSNVVTLSQQGHEIGAHTRTHPDLTTLSESDLQWEIVGSKNDLNALGIGNVRTFSYPFGSFNNSVLNVVKNNFEGARSTVTLFNTETANKYLLKSVSLTNDTSVTEVKGWIDQARRDGTWLILTFHRIDEENADYYSTTSSDFNAIVNYLKAKNVPVRTNIDGIRLLTN